MASALLTLNDLINYQLERLKLDEFVYKDELQLQRYLADLDRLPTTHQQQQQQQQQHQLQHQSSSSSQQQQQYSFHNQKTRRHKQTRKELQHQALQVPEPPTPTQTPPSQSQSQNITAETGEQTTCNGGGDERTVNGNGGNGGGGSGSGNGNGNGSVGGGGGGGGGGALSSLHARSELTIGSRGAIGGVTGGGGVVGGMTVSGSTRSLRCRRSTSAQADDGNGVFGTGAGSGGGDSAGGSSGGGAFDLSTEMYNSMGGFGLANNNTTTTTTGATTIAPTTAASRANSEDSTASDLQKGFKAQVLEWFHQLHDQTESYKSDEESRRIREIGNDTYRKERQPLKACDLYTEALFLAPAEDSIAAAMAHANRSTVLHDYGMYEQAYDDCLCALDLGYPEEYLALIKLRQASCALKMRNFVLCEQHLHELLHMELTELFQERTHEIWHECELLKMQKFEMGIQTDEDDMHECGTKLYEIAWHDNSNIITTNKGSYMRAVTNIANNTPIFKEDAALYVCSGEGRICDNCGVTQFVPFPCLFCSNRHAVYCSRKCRAQHASTHALECFAHQIELYEEFDEAFNKARLLQLAMRMLVTGLPQVMPHCRKRPTVSKMWAAFNGVLTERTDIPYSALLRLESHADQSDLESLIAFAIVARIMAIYLNECTDFFEQLQLIMPTTVKISNNDEWELLCAALMLRHICQLQHKNLIHCPSFVLPLDPHVLSPINEFSIWSSWQRVHAGQLHLLAGDVATVAYAVFPHTLSVCRHSCDSTLYRKFSGRKLTAFATCDIAMGGKITNCFSQSNYRQSLYETRCNELTAKGIDCKCDKCFRPYPDEDFHKFHRYRCDNPNCKQIFTPTHLKYTQNLQWWNSDYYTRPMNNGSELLVCNICDEPQKLEWYWTFVAALIDCDAIEERCKLYAAIDRAEMHLIEMHECKVALARQLVERLLMMHREGGPNPLDEWEFNKLGSLMRSSIHIVAAQYRFSIEYVQHMSYFWDVMALSNYKCSDKELMQMLNALEFIPDEFKEIFINYYEDFIAPKFADETYTNLLDTQV